MTTIPKPDAYRQKSTGFTYYPGQVGYDLTAQRFPEEFTPVWNSRPEAEAPTDAGAEWVRGDWMQTYTGARFYPMDPRPDEIDIRDIAHALSLICRYGGHVDRFYSVAEHCVLMSQYVPAEHALWALLHDASEAYVGDMVRPLKRQLPEYVAAEDRVIGAIVERFGLPSTTMPAEVKDADNRILLTERDVLMPATRYPWNIEHLTRLPVDVRGLSPADAEAIYLDRFTELTASPEGSDR